MEEMSKEKQEEQYWHTGEPIDKYGRYVVRVSDGEFSFYVIDIFENGCWLNLKKKNIVAWHKIPPYESRQGALSSEEFLIYGSYKAPFLCLYLIQLNYREKRIEGIKGN